MPDDYSFCTKFQEGQPVRYTGSDLDDLPIGSVGVILWSYHWPCYEVEFTYTDGKIYDAIYEEADLEAA